MATNRWTHDATVTVIVGHEGGEDSIDFDVRLYVNGSPATSDYFDKSFGNWLPGDPAEIEMERFEICEPKEGGGFTYRKPVEASYPDANDQGVIDAVESWFADHADEVWESVDDEGDDDCDRLYDRRRDDMMTGDWP